MKNHSFFIGLILVLVGILAVYTGLSIYNEGINLFAVFIPALFSGTWAGQFNFDFMCYLVLSGFWIAWRGHFSTKSIGLGMAASIIGFLFLGPFIIYCLAQEKGDLIKVLIGNRHLN